MIEEMKKLDIVLKGNINRKGIEWQCNTAMEAGFVLLVKKVCVSADIQLKSESSNIPA